MQQVPARKCKITLDKAQIICYSTNCSAGVAHLVERHLAKVEVASSSLVARSKKQRHDVSHAFVFWKRSGQRVEQGASEARKRPGGAFVARCACRGAVVPRASLVARSIKHHNEGCGAFSFTLPWVGEGSADGAARGKGGVLFRKREHPLYIPQRKAYIAGLAFEELHALRNRLRCTWLRHESSASRYRQQPRALRSARVTVARRRTAVRAAALLRSPPGSASGNEKRPRQRSFYRLSVRPRR